MEDRPSQQAQRSRAQVDVNAPQGVLYKRRDVFQKRWRPRWFVLQPHEKVLTYYLMSPRNNHPRNTAMATSTISASNTATPTPTTGTASRVEESVDYDVVPRGTIYLPGCRVERVEHAMTRPPNLFVFTITPPSPDESPCYLAAATEDSRTMWVEQLTRVCRDSVSTEEANESMSTEDDTSESSSDMWEDLDPPSTVFHNVPNDLSRRIQAVLREHLPFCQDRPEHKWTTLLELKDGVKSYQRKSNNNCTMIKTVGIIPHHPKQVFNLLVDIKRRRDFETNVRFDERLKRYNPHTFLDYYAYRAVWPTSARDFGVAVHWRVLTTPTTNGDDKEQAICLLGVSDEAADELRPPESDHVRANLFISLYLLRLVDQNQCHVTRILSYDLCGNVPKSLTNTIVQQQATIPVILTQHLTQTEPSPDERLTGGDIANVSIIEDVIERLPDGNDGNVHDSVRRRLQLAESGGISTSDDTTAAGKGSKDGVVELRELSTTVTAIILMTPLMLWRFADMVQLPGRELYFVIAAVLAVRAVVLSHFGHLYHAGPALSPVGQVTCRLSVDLKGVLRFLAHRKDEQEDEQIDSPEVSVIHIVLSAIAQAMDEAEALKCRRVFIPFLGINGYYFPRGRGVDISVLLTNPRDTKREYVATLLDVGSLSVRSIAEELDHEKRRLRQHEATYVSPFVDKVLSSLGFATNNGAKATALGSCLVVASPDSDHSEVDMDIAPSPLFSDRVNVVVVVGGVRLVKDPTTKPNGTPVKASPVTRMSAAKPTLCISVTIESPICTIAECRQFAERLQKLVRFPEMCDE